MVDGCDDIDVYGNDASVVYDNMCYSNISKCVCVCVCVCVCMCQSIEYGEYDDGQECDGVSVGDGSVGG